MLRQLNKEHIQYHILDTFFWSLFQPTPTASAPAFSPATSSQLEDARVTVDALTYFGEHLTITLLLVLSSARFPGIAVSLNKDGIGFSAKPPSDR